MPLPVSATVIRTTERPPSPAAPRVVPTVTVPAGDARLSRALPIRFSRILRSTRGSVRTGGSASAQLALELAPARLADAADRLADGGVDVARLAGRLRVEAGVIRGEVLEI